MLGETLPWFDGGVISFMALVITACYTLTAERFCVGGHVIAAPAGAPLFSWPDILYEKWKNMSTNIDKTDYEIADLHDCLVLLASREQEFLDLVPQLWWLCSFIFFQVTETDCLQRFTFRACCSNNIDQHLISPFVLHQLG